MAELKFGVEMDEIIAKDYLRSMHLALARGKTNKSKGTLSEKLSGLISNWTKIINDCQNAEHDISDYRKQYLETHQSYLDGLTGLLDEDDQMLLITLANQLDSVKYHFLKRFNSMTISDNPGAYDATAYIIAELEAVISQS